MKLLWLNWEVNLCTSLPYSLLELNLVKFGAL